MTELLARLPTQEEKEGLLFIQAVDKTASEQIEKNFIEHGLMIARLAIAVWFERQKTKKGDTRDNK